MSEAVTKPYTLREMNDDDTWAIIDILTKTIPDDIKEAFSQLMTGEKSLRELGTMVVADMAIKIIKNIPAARQEITDFCASMIGVEVEQLKKMPPFTTPRIIKDVFTVSKNADFFKELSESIS